MGRRRTPLAPVIGFAVAAVVGLAACSGGGEAAPGNPTGPPGTVPPVATEGSGDAAVDPAGTAPITDAPRPDGSPDGSPVCGLATDAVVADAAIGLLAGGPDEALVPQRAALRDALDALAASITRFTGPARNLVAPGFDPTRAREDRPRAVEALHVAMIEECGVRLSGLGVLRPDRDPDDALAGLGVASLAGDTCEVAEVLRWADVQWRIAPDGGTQDRYGVVVRHALGVIARDPALELPADLGTVDLSGWSLSGEHRLAIVGLDADLRRGCDGGLEPTGLLMQGTPVPSAAAVASHPAPDWGVPATVDADTSHARWCAVVDDLYARDTALAVADALDDDDAPADERAVIETELRLMLGALRVASRSGGSIATLDDVRDVIAASRTVERADLSAAGRLTEPERRAVGELDRVMVANCGVGFSSATGVLGQFGFQSSFPDLVPTASASPSGTTTTSTSLPTYLPDTAVAVVGDSLTQSARTEIVESLAALGLGNVVVDGQVSRRMTSSTDTIRSGEAVVTEIAAVASPRVWVIALGTNDVASGSSADSIRASIRRVLDAIPDDTLVVWVDTYIRDEPEAVAAGNRLIREVVGERPGTYVADFASYADDPGVVGSDGVHLTTAGRRLFANVIANGIAAVLGRNPQFDLSTVAPPAPPVVVPPAPPPLPPGTPAPTTTTTSTAVTTTTLDTGATTTTTTTMATTTTTTAVP